MTSPKILASAFLCLLLAAPFAHADNITVWDGHGTTCTAVLGGCEDNETEPGTLQHQVWDLEAFMLNGNILSIIGGYNFKDGVTYPYGGGTGSLSYTSGDIFIDTDGIVSYGTSTPHVGSPTTGNGSYGSPYIGTNTAKWDWAIRINFTSATGGTYNVYDITDSTLVVSPTDIDDPSQPWRVKDSSLPGVYLTGAFTFQTITSPTYQGQTLWAGHTPGTQHYEISGFNLGFLGDEQDFTVKFTMQCGNDNIIGKGTTVPEPTTVVLIGLGLVGLAARSTVLRRN